MKFKGWIYIWLGLNGLLILRTGGIMNRNWIKIHTEFILEYFWTISMLLTVLTILRGIYLKKTWVRVLSWFNMVLVLFHPYYDLADASDATTTHFFRGNDHIDRALFFCLGQFLIASFIEFIYWRHKLRGWRESKPRQEA